MTPSKNPTNVERIEKDMYIFKFTDKTAIGHSASEEELFWRTVK